MYSVLALKRANVDFNIYYCIVHKEHVILKPKEGDDAYKDVAGGTRKYKIRYLLYMKIENRHITDNLNYNFK